MPRLQSCVPGAVQHEQRRTVPCVCTHHACAAHDALQTRDRTKLRPGSGPSFARSRISGAPLRARACVDRASAVYALALRRIRDTQPPYVMSLAMSPLLQPGSP